MTQLPQEIVSLIVLHLSSKPDLYNCTFINKAFYHAANPLLWHTPNLDTNDTTQRFIACLKATQHSFGAGHHVHNLCLSHRHCTDADFILECHCPTHHRRHRPALPSTHSSYLEPLRVARSRHISALTLCPLTYLAIEHPGPGVTTSEKVINDLLCYEGLQQLVLDVGDNDFLHRLFSSATAVHAWPHLDTLTISRYGGGDNNNNALVHFLHSHRPRCLKKLNLIRGKYTDTLLNAIFYAALDLMHVSLIFTPSITDQGVRHLVCQFPNLMSVDLFGCNMTPAMFPEATSACHSPFGSDMPMFRLDQDAINKIRRQRAV
ncbi:unnamed protein product [Absidia cylindrospora]